MSLENQVKELTGAICELVDILKIMNADGVPVPHEQPRPETAPVVAPIVPTAPPVAAVAPVTPTAPLLPTVAPVTPTAPPLPTVAEVVPPPVPATTAIPTTTPPAPPAHVATIPPPPVSEGEKKARRINSDRAAKINDLMVQTCKNLGVKEPIIAALQVFGVGSPADLTKVQADEFVKNLEAM